MKEVKQDFIDRVKVDIREKILKRKSVGNVATNLKSYLYSILKKMPNSDILESDQQDELVNKAYRVIHPILEKRVKEESPKSNLKSRFFSRASFLSGLIGKTRKAKHMNRNNSINMSRSATMNNANTNMNSMMRALNAIKL